MILDNCNLMDYQLIELKSLVQEEIEKLEVEFDTLNSSNSRAEKIFVAYKLGTLDELLLDANRLLYEKKLEEKLLSNLYD